MSLVIDEKKLVDEAALKLGPILDQFKMDIIKEIENLLTTKKITLLIENK